MIGGTGPQGAPTPITVEFNQWYEVHQAALKCLSGNFGERDAIEFAYFCGRGSVSKSPISDKLLEDRFMAERFPPLLAVCNRQHLRQELWAKTHAAISGSDQAYERSFATGAADKALQEFDERFK